MWFINDLDYNLENKQMSNCLFSLTDCPDTQRYSVCKYLRNLEVLTFVKLEAEGLYLCYSYEVTLTLLLMTAGKIYQ